MFSLVANLFSIVANMFNTANHYQATVNIEDKARFHRHRQRFREYLTRQQFLGLDAELLDAVFLWKTTVCVLSTMLILSWLLHRWRQRGGETDEEDSEKSEVLMKLKLDVLKDFNTQTFTVYNNRLQCLDALEDLMIIRGGNGQELYPDAQAEDSDSSDSFYDIPVVHENSAIHRCDSKRKPPPHRYLVQLPDNCKQRRSVHFCSNDGGRCLNVRVQSGNDTLSSGGEESLCEWCQCSASPDSTSTFTAVSPISSTASSMPPLESDTCQMDQANHVSPVTPTSRPFSRELGETTGEETGFYNPLLTGAHWKQSLEVNIRKRMVCRLWRRAILLVRIVIMLLPERLRQKTSPERALTGAENLPHTEANNVSGSAHFSNSKTDFESKRAYFERGGPILTEGKSVGKRSKVTVSKFSPVCYGHKAEKQGKWVSSTPREHLDFRFSKIPGTNQYSGRTFSPPKSSRSFLIRLIGQEVTDQLEMNLKQNTEHRIQNTSCWQCIRGVWKKNTEKDGGVEMKAKASPSSDQVACSSKQPSTCGLEKECSSGGAPVNLLECQLKGSKAMDHSNGLFDCQSPTSPFLGSLRVLHLLEDLRGSLELMVADEREGLRCQVPDATAEGLVEWLQGRLTNGHGSLGGELVYRERLFRLESDKECLVLQVSVLTDQVEVQGEKIMDLDMFLEEHRQKLNTTEEMLQLELMSRTTFETQKLELMTEVSSLKLKLSSVERERRDSEGIFQEVNDLRVRVTDMENERVQYEKKLKSTKEELMALQRQLEEREGEIKRLRDQALLGVTTQDGIQNGEEDVEVQRMQKAVESLLTANNEKDGKIEELQQSLMGYQKAQDTAMSIQGKKDNEEGQSEGSAVVPVAMDTEKASLGDEEETGEPQLIPCAELLPELELAGVSTPKAVFETEQGGEIQLAATESSPHQTQSGSPDHGTSVEESKVQGEPSQKSSPTATPTEGERFGNKKARSSFGRGFFKICKRAASTPNLAETERKGTEHLDLAGGPSHKSPDGDSTHTLPSPEGKEAARGIRKFFGSELDAPFARWTKGQVCAWLQEQGLGLHVNHAQLWIRSGQTLLQASQHALEKEFGIKHPLHRKKLQLALQAMGSEEEDAKGKLDFNWVTRWLDDIGLPQYKSQFDEGRVDGRMLHYMTVDDLLGLKVGSVLHHLSIKRAIQVLRLNRYEPNCLRRRPSDENNITPAEICQWTNHRVMEWLHSVDLAEYAPSLRGSGVHGGLMVLEPHFNVETLALLLNIPPNKTLLRCHLATNFHLLIGSEAQRLKQGCLENPDCTLLTATAKVKPRRLSFGSFWTLRRMRQEDSEEYVCPMDVQMPQSSSFHPRGRPGPARAGTSLLAKRHPEQSMLKEDEFFREMSSRSPDASATERTPTCEERASLSPCQRITVKRN